MDKTPGDAGRSSLPLLTNSGFAELEERRSEDGEMGAAGLGPADSLPYGELDSFLKNKFSLCRMILS